MIPVFISPTATTIIASITTASSNAVAAGLMFVALTTTSVPPPTPDLPILEVVKVYGRLAGSQCYGMKAPIGSSCQLQRQDLERALDLDNNNKLSRNEFESKLLSSSDQQGRMMEFQWPLKPYGIDKSLSKTAIMNKGAETRVFMEELERRGLYDKRNPTGPLPTSLRPTLNKQIQQEEIDPRAIDLVFQAFSSSGGEQRIITEGQIEKIFGGREEIDYYDFLKIIGTDSVLWPN